MLFNKFHYGLLLYALFLEHNIIFLVTTLFYIQIYVGLEFYIKEQAMFLFFIIMIFFIFETTLSDRYERSIKSNGQGANSISSSIRIKENNLKYRQVG